MKKNILILLGSPRKKGNTAILANQVHEGAKLGKANVEVIYLNSKNIKPCQACNKCQNEGAKGCVVNDDMQLIYPKFIAADSVVMTTPIYFCNVSAQIKLFIDRLYCFSSHNRSSEQKNMIAGKNMVFILTYEAPDPFLAGAVNAIFSLQNLCEIIQAGNRIVLYGRADKAGEINNNKDLLKKAFFLGKILSDTPKFTKQYSRIYGLNTGYEIRNQDSPVNYGIL